MKKIILLSMFILLIVVGCSSAPETVQDPKQLTFLSNGIWLGSLPCEDCDVIDYQLNLKNDFTFVQKFVYKGKSDEFIVDEGNWVFDSDSVIELESYDYAKLFLISGKELIMLDEYGDRINSESEKKYHLHKDASTVKEIKDVKEVKVEKPVEDDVDNNSQHYQNKFLAGVDFIARGNEPNWTLEIDFEKSIAFATTDDIKINTPAVAGIKAQDSDVTLYRAKSDKGELIITVIKDNCEDNMSGEIFPYKVRVEAKGPDDTNYNPFEGCGNYLYDNRLYDIYVMEEMTGINFKKEKLQKGMPQFEFNLTEMRFSGHAGCNTIGGSINVVGNKITFGALMGTLMACPNMKIEKAVIEALNQKTVTYSIDKMKLTIVSGKTKMVFKKVD
ncbi:MAG: META domain-containing protein [Ignavibacteriales bacterium]|nr:META domain-containing protein [Ignavibacteriales bacterium]